MKTYVLYSVFFCLGITAPFILEWASSDHEIERATFSNGVINFTNPYLECVGEIDRDQALMKYKKIVSSLVAVEKKKDNDLRVSVYARDLINGPWMGYNERDNFYTASFSKVPVMLYILALSDEDQSILDKELLVDYKQIHIYDNLSDKPEFRVQDGRYYKISDLLYHMVTYSDNYSLDVLVTEFGEANIDNFMQKIGFFLERENGETVTNAKLYASLFRVLYNSSLLSRNRSEFALMSLADNALVGGIKKHVNTQQVPIASKFAVFVPWRNDSPLINENQFHECGIVYIPGDPHALCIMTSSPNKQLEELQLLVERISGEFFKIKDVYVE